MTDDQHGDQHGDRHDGHGEAAPPGGGRWDPLPQGDYDDGATAFVKLPEGGVDALFASSDTPLAAPGHGYVPPQITVTPATGTDPAATGSWTMPAAPVDGTQWQLPDGGHEQAAQQGYGGYPPQHDPYGGATPYDAHAGQGEGFTYRPGATGQWDFSEAAPPEEAEPGSGQDVTGQWSIPVAGGDLPDESGEFTASALAEQWGTGAPATLPGGAPAPWATQPAAQPWGGHTPGAGPDTDGPRAPGHPADPYAHAPAAGTGHEAPPADHTPADGPRGADEAPEGPVERPADPAEEGAAQSVPEAAEEPVPGPAAVDRTDSTDRTDRTGPTDRTDPSDRADATEDAEPADASDSSVSAEDADPAGHAGAADDAPADAETDAPADVQSAPPADGEHAPAAAHEEHPLASYVLRVNGTDRPVTDAWIGESLLYVLRERLGLAGAKDGCSQGECGACNVQVDGRLVASCLVPAVTSAGSEVRTVEGLAADGQPSDVQRALARRGAVQCGFCVPGMAMTVHNLLEGNPAPTDLEARQALCGNLCRCSGYRGVLEAVQEVVAEREAHADAHTGADGDEPRIPHQAGPGAGGVNASAFEPQSPPGAPDGPAPHDRPYGDRPQDDHPYDRNHGQDGGHA
ncbi:2Fe-2S iron-sulfur cluster-binding protein [Streptomyces parvulus]|uniref:2Fe-2S iron-sulfur cluster-binding protein n=1 Tax=Streptomyces parvulus TaxID=146923 RepID=UPI0037A21844